MASVRERAADLRYARIARKHGLQNSLRALWEARAAGVTPAMALTILEKESGGRNVFGHDPTTSIPDSWKGTKVTRDKYRHYKNRRRMFGMQGVGPMQLTWYEFQDAADELGGCWKPKYNMRLAYRHLGALMRQYGRWDGVKRYNGDGPAADAYMRDAKLRHEKWHRRLHG